jgi:16S rRNA (cytosine1402-N4)-methyltransferase
MSEDSTEVPPPSSPPPSSPPHVPVLPREVLEHLTPALDASGETRFLDGTVGAAGHASLLLEALPSAQLLGLDRDLQALELARARLAPFGERARLVLERLAFRPLAGALLDLGISSMQVDDGERGFSFRFDGPLDMRMDPTRGPTAADLLATLDATALANLIYELGEERHSRKIAAAIVMDREKRPFTRTGDLSGLLERILPRSRPRQRGRGRPRRGIHPATRTFQALRLAVNDELGQLERSLPALWEQLAIGGRLAVISFHSLEDRRVKNFFRELKREKRARVLTKKPLIASDEECERNPRARSAKLRVAERLA